MRERLERFLISLGAAGRGGSWGALGQCISKHGMRVPYISRRTATAGFGHSRAAASGFKRLG